MANESKEMLAIRSLFSDLNAVESQRELERVLEWHERSGARIVFPGHPDYPFSSSFIENPPAFVSFLGHAPWKDRAAISIVGTREPTSRALEWMQLHFAEFVRRTGALTVSGGARGVDLESHLISVRAGVPTVVFLPAGLAVPYPREWLRWQDKIIDTGGALVSTFAPFQEIRRSHFEGRNRLIAAMGEMLFVVEARRQSGSIMSARLAREMDRTVCCLPGPPSDPSCAGNLDLLFDGALPIRDADDLEVLFELVAFEKNWRGSRSIPGATQAQESGTHENQIGNPHRQGRRDLPLT